MKYRALINLYKRHVITENGLKKAIDDGIITANVLKKAVDDGIITVEQYAEIAGEEYN